MPELPEAYSAIAAQCLSALRRSSDLSDEAWVSTPGGRGVRIWYRDDPVFICTRGVAQIRCEPEAFLSQILRCEDRPDWDSQCEMGKRVASFDRAEGGADLIHLRYSGVWPLIRPRDISLLRAWGRESDGSCWLSSEQS